MTRMEGSRFTLWNANEGRFARGVTRSDRSLSRRLPEATQRINLSHGGLSLVLAFYYGLFSTVTERRRNTSGEIPGSRLPTNDQAAPRYIKMTPVYVPPDKAAPLQAASRRQPRLPQIASGQSNGVV
jgi:hypothetical protein